MRADRDGKAIVAAVAVAVACVAQGAGEFERWVGHDRAMRAQTGMLLKVGGFGVRLPLGWIRDKASAQDDAAESGTLRLLYVGHDARHTYAPGRAALHSCVFAEAPAGARLGVAAPSESSGWVPITVAGLRGYRGTEPGETDDVTRFVCQVPAERECLVMALDVPGTGAAWPDYAEGLLAALRYAGGATRSAPSRLRAAAVQAGAFDVPADSFRGSPFAARVQEARRAIAGGQDPACGNYVGLLDDGLDALLVRLHMIRHAAHSIKIQTFIWANDESGRLFMYELIEAAKRGVQVQVITDHIASFKDVKLAAFLATAHPNLAIKHYHPAGNRIDPNPLQEVLNYLRPRSNQRMHNKLLLVDNVVFITGGRNLDNTYYNQALGKNFRDRDVLVVGPMATYAAGSFSEYWSYRGAVLSAKLKDVKRVIRRGKFKRYETREDFALRGYFDALDAAANDTGLIERKFVKNLLKVDEALYVSDPPAKKTRVYTAWRRGTIAKQIEDRMRAAQQSLLLQTPYLLLDGGMLKIFRDLRQRRPDLRLEASSNSFGSTDNALVYAANFRMRPLYVRDTGLVVHEYMPFPADLRVVLPNYDELAQRREQSKSSGSSTTSKDPYLSIHAKSFVVDGEVAYVGSYNFDPRSIWLNTEVGLFVTDRAFAAALAGSMERDMHPDNSWVIAKRRAPLSAEQVARWSAGHRARPPQEVLWAFRHTAGFEWLRKQDPVPPQNPEFYSLYKDIGVFPGTDEDSTARRIMTLLLTTISDLTVPLL